MEDRAIDVKFDTKVDDIGRLTTDQLATECNGIYQQMEVVGTIGLMMATEIGRRLITVKERLPHGSFESWCSENLNFSKRKAERMMLIAKKADDENSILAKTPTLSDLSISKAFAILSAPEDIAAEVVETSDIDDMTVRELQEQIDKLKEEKKEAEEKADWAQTQLDIEIETGEEKVREAQEKKDQELATANAQITSLKEHIEELKGETKGSSNQEEIENLKKQIEKLEAAAKQKEKEVENSVKIAVSNSKAEWEKASAKEKKETEQELASLRAETDKLRKDARLASNSTMLEFKFQVNAFQTQFNEILKTIGEAELEASEKMATAFRELLTKLSAKI
ncbi:MAG: DUF3102 domain-containing protein [Oribacterium sp.]|nr:DUF3102 domain-containing protein [Oribacterium sp.]